MRSLLIATCFAFSYGMVGQVHLRAQEPSPLIQEVLAKHKAARESIRTLSATVRVEATHPKREVLGEGEYWRDGNTVRVRRHATGGGFIDYRISGGEVRVVTTLSQDQVHNKQGIVGAASRTSEDDFPTRTDVYYEMLLSLKSPDGNFADLEELIAASTSKVEVATRHLDGDECVAIAFALVSKTGSQSQYTYWLARSKNYLIQQIDCIRDKQYAYKRKITSWDEPIPGVIVPIASELTALKDGKIWDGRTAVLSGVVVNEPIPASVMALPPLPRGSLLTDKIAGVQGNVDANWRPIGKMKPYAPVVLPPQTVSPDAAEHTTQSTTEPTSTGDWIVLASMGLLIAGLGVLGYRRYHQARSRRASAGDAS